MVPGTLVFSPTFVSTVSAQPRSSHQFGPVFSQGSQSVHFTQFVQSDRAQYPQSAICPQTDESKSFGLTTSYLPTTTITHRTCSSSDHNYPSTAPHGMSRTNDRHNRYVFSDEELRSQLEQCAITDMSSLPLDRGSSTPASTTGCSSDRPHDELTESLSSSFTQGSVSDIPLSNLEEILARSSIDDVYLGPVEDKYGKLLSLDPTLRVGSETASLPYSSSSLAFSPPGVFMVTEMWPSFMSERLSHCNHRIHCMNLASLRKCLYDHGLNQLGSLAILRRRLQEFVRRIREAQSADASRLRLSHETGDFLTSSDATDQLIEEQPTAWQSSPDKAPNCASMDSNCSRTMKLPKPVVLTPDTFYSYLLIIDLEATCDFQEHRQSAPEYPHEIIEFPILLYNTRTRKCIGVFHAYCKPKLRPDLTAFCTSLTQISQHEVDNAHPFPHVLARIEDWLFNRHGLSNVRCAVVCDCGADMGKFMRIQCRLDGIPLPSWATVWINLSKAFRVFYKLPLRNRVTLSTMLRDLNLSFIGQQHRGLDDAINILRIVRTLLADGCLLRVNERVDFGRAPTYVAAVPRLVAETTSGLMGSRLILLCKKSRLSTGTSSQGDKNDTYSRSTLASDLPEDHIQSLLWLADVQKSRVSKEQ
ncbi:3'-5' exoribonuclease 1 [Clonorchis sinensis]|uniref:3'-5' exoribonuclease 1 n=2 Tax=Clonorchis sinensis TaxID=79923 RepID=A0A8T1M916_CLOSI|nr:3'-5' exoribonuclease 1 [Clonorchis sinensis]GAA37315.2 3'-5' exoribonuclease 1 [Clonorchis sinensis]